jgi:hypothetical protein
LDKAYNSVPGSGGSIPLHAIPCVHGLTVTPADYGTLIETLKAQHFTNALKPYNCFVPAPVCSCTLLKAFNAKSRGCGELVWVFG